MARWEVGRAITVILVSVISQYSPGVMDSVVDVRQSRDGLPERLPRVDGYIAVKDCSEVGDIWWAMSTSGQWERFLVADCAHPLDGTVEWMEERNVAFEVDWKTAERWGIVGELVEGQWTRGNPIEGIVLSP